MLHWLNRFLNTPSDWFPLLPDWINSPNILTDWTQYISTGIAEMLPIYPTTFMMIVGVIEIIAGILVLTKTKIGAYIVAIWLTVIAFSLLFSWRYVDVAVRDLVMAIAAFCLAKLYDETIFRH